MRALRTALAAVILSFTAGATAPSLLAQASVSATPWTALHASRVRLVAGPTKTDKGHYLAGLEIAMDDGWKTYWRMPGDSGVPPTFDWTGSNNVAAVKVLYPAPALMPEAGGVAIGYKHQVLLPIEITPQDPAKPIALKLALEFGICREICVPATGNFELSIPVGSAGSPPAEIAAALDRVPRPHASRRKSDPELKRVAINRDGPSPKLVIEASFAGAAREADVFVEAPKGLYVPIPKRAAAQASGLVRFETDLGRALAEDLQGRTITLTLVGEAGASEARWTLP